jgi:tRNA(Ile)-lysidine synthase
LLGPDDVLLLAHHRDDQDETILLHLLQGRGLFGIPTERSLGVGRLLRPLLELPRSTLHAYATERSLEWLQDPGNEDLRLDRNFVRLSLLPELKARFPELSARLARVLSHAARTDTALVEGLGLQRNPLPLDMLTGLSAATAGTVLRHWLVGQHAAAGVSDAALQEFCRQLTVPVDRQPRLALPAGSLRRFRGNLYLLESAPELRSSYELSVPGTLSLPHGLLTLTLEQDAAARPGSESARLPCSQQQVQVQDPVRVTFASELEPGTRMQVNGHARKASELMRLAGLPPWVRDAQPLLMDRHGLVAIAGVAARDRSAGTDCRFSWSALAGDVTADAAREDADARPQVPTEVN